MGEREGEREREREREKEWEKKIFEQRDSCSFSEAGVNTAGWGGIFSPVGHYELEPLAMLRGRAAGLLSRQREMCAGQQRCSPAQTHVYIKVPELHGVTRVGERGRFEVKGEQWQQANSYHRPCEGQHLYFFSPLRCKITECSQLNIMLI